MWALGTVVWYNLIWLECLPLIVTAASTKSHQCNAIMVVHKEHNAKDNLYLFQEAFYAQVFSHFNQAYITLMQLS